MIKEMSHGDLPEFIKLLEEVDDAFIPTLSSRVNLHEYALKLLKLSKVFGTYENQDLAGAVAIYMNDYDSRVAYCPFIAILPVARGKGLSRTLLEHVIEVLKKKGFTCLALTVREDNVASQLYMKLGFEVIDSFTYEGSIIKGLKMELNLQ